ncbi:e9ae963b-33f3-43b3-a80f-a1b1aff0fd4c [Thermothielavioides terrestris]|uniref:E9ae963b-33f3-43b3-a80f-a1b1aff0fd4c n=1 Tax=Thermothielavioides terrestris TaxID=2587410 RepID=A0A3S4D8E5_9PEZI|nr:e9ae963b-33f3-43b3-a80f-a1b1aff0fd4c [Thermothielavioides terrestris]
MEALMLEPLRGSWVSGRWILISVEPPALAY